MWSWLLDVFQNILWNKTWIFWAWACKGSKASQPLLSLGVRSGQSYQSQSNPCHLNLCFYFEYRVLERLVNRMTFDDSSWNQHRINQFHNDCIQRAEFQDQVFNQYLPICMKSPALNSPPWRSLAYEGDLYAFSVASWSPSGHRKKMFVVGTATLFPQVFEWVRREPKKEEFR